MAKRDARLGVTLDDAEAYKELGAEVHPNRPHGKDPHIHVGPVDHIPVRIEGAMTRYVFDVIREPRGAVFRGLLQALSPAATELLLVLRDGVGLSDAGRDLLSELQPYLVGRDRRSSWPGTALLSGQATVLRFIPTAPCLDALVAASDRLFGWQQPALPEDLALVRGDETAALASISHENDAYLELEQEEYASLIRSLPEIADMVRVRAAAP